MEKIGNFLTAYLIASFVSVITSFAGWLFLRWAFELEFNFWLFLLMVWLVIVGLPTLFVASNKLLRMLGWRPKVPAWLSQSGTRLVPVGGRGDFAHTVPLLTSDGNSGSKMVELKEFQIISGHYVISHQVLTNFLRTAWNRQRQGKDGLSRTYWVGGRHLDRSEYEAILKVLVREELVHGRSQGRSGKLIMPAASALVHLEDRL